MKIAVSAATTVVTVATSPGGTSASTTKNA